MEPLLVKLLWCRPQQQQRQGQVVTVTQFSPETIDEIIRRYKEFPKTETEELDEMRGWLMVLATLTASIRPSLTARPSTRLVVRGKLMTLPMGTSPVTLFGVTNAPIATVLFYCCNITSFVSSVYIIALLSVPKLFYRASILMYNHLVAIDIISLIGAFEKMSGMKINYHKSELVPCNMTEDQIHSAAHILGCPVGAFPIKYLGVPLHYEKLRRGDIQPLVDKILKRGASWRGKLLSQAAKVTLIQSCLASIPVYLLSFIKFPKWAIKTLNAHFANCLWSDSEGNHKYHLANWESVSMLKEFGGLGIPSLRDLNTCLLASWIKRYQADDGKLWKDLIDFKYNTSKPNIFFARDTNSSQFFKGFVWAAKAASMGFKWKIGNGNKVKFWEDNWLGPSSIAIQFWDLYTLVNEKTGTVAELWDGQNLRCTFRRTVSERLGRVWMEVVQLASTITFSDEEDALIWKFTSNGVYSSQSL
jgi:hypothetical protein